jgi:cytochrome c biogenesis protein CcmG/thiol:disulfide interchange protein DsbE
MTTPAETASPPRRGRLALLPLILFGILAALFLYRLGTGDPARLPSALIGKPVPAFALQPVPGLEVNGRALAGFATADLKGQVSVVNVFASWCVPCHDEHPFLMELAKDNRIQMLGINYKDVADNARRFIGRFGNPYAKVGADPSGRASIDWGVYGVPETFIVGRDGTILYKFVGPITEDVLRSVIRPELEKALARG